jgi:putative transposase
MTSPTTKPDSLQPAADMAGDLFDNWFDPLEAEVRARSREFIEELLRGELEAALSRPRYGRSQMSGREARASVAGHRHGSRTRSLTGTFGPIEIAVPRARLTTADGKTTEWKSQTLRAYQRRTLAADALIASTYLAGTNTRRVRRALAALFGGTVGKDTVSRTWRKVKSDWDAWHTRSLTREPIVRLILDGTVVRVRLSGAKVFLGWRTKIFRAADAFCARRREGPFRFIQNRPRTSVVALKSDAEAERSKDQLSRDF